MLTVAKSLMVYYLVENNHSHLVRIMISYAGTDHSGSGNTDDLVPPIELCIRTRLNELYKLNVII